MKKDKEITKVIFRIFKDTKEVIAIFPEIISGAKNKLEVLTECSSYMHTGQHGACCVDIIEDTRPSTSQESYKLKKELESLGYNLKVITRFNRAHPIKRLKEYNNHE